MTRRDFQLIADCIRETRETFGNYPPIDRLIREFSRRLPATNPRFDSGRFERACEPRASDALDGYAREQDRQQESFMQ